MKKNMIFTIAPLRHDEKKDFQKIYFHALENDWRTLEGHNEKDRWSDNFDQWFHLGHTILVGKINRNIVGYICGDSGRILHLWINKDYRNNSYGIRLINEFLNFQRKKEIVIKCVKIKVYKKNFGYFDRLGYEVVSKFETSAIYKIELES